MSITFSANGLSFDDQVNMNGRNALYVADALGISPEDAEFGDMDAQDFLGRVVMALAIAPNDDGMPSYEHDRIPGKARVIEGSRPTGYLQQRLQQLHAVALWAIKHETPVYWG